MHDLQSKLRKTIRSVPDFPKPGILFRDITPVLQDPLLQTRCVEAVTRAFPPAGFDAVGGIEARGFIWGALVADAAQKPFFPFRKAGKLPWKTHRAAYSLEYGEAEIEIHTDAFEPGARILIIDDLLATGGTAVAAVELVQQAGGDIVGIALLIELAGLGGREKLGEAGIKEEQLLRLITYE